MARRFSDQYKQLVSDVTATVSAQPLNYLQNFGGATDPFLYERLPGKVRLKPGVTYCLRRFYPLVQQLSRTHWIGHLKSNHRNDAILGGPGDLDDFLFSASRQSLTLIGERLRKLDGQNCFYCGLPLTQDSDVDHYVPFATYPRDLAENFVLAHPKCNRSKSDSLAAKPYLERWLERLSTRGSVLAEIGSEAGIVSSSRTAGNVANWAYRNACQASGRAWLAPGEYETVRDDYLALFSGIERSAVAMSIGLPAS
jgi:5-methylcytosine-specific restriction endonuclease McrA